MEILILLVMLSMFWIMSRSAKKQRETLAQRQKEAAVPGTWVVTIGGFLGKVVAVDGDVVTLESPSGVETIWTMQAIREAKEPDYGTLTEDDELSDIDDVAGSTSAGYAADDAVGPDTTPARPADDHLDGDDRPGTDTDPRLRGH